VCHAISHEHVKHVDDDDYTKKPWENVKNIGNHDIDGNNNKKHT